MKTIIVATDFSPCALNAANYAVKMALAIDADVLLLHVYQIPEINLEIPVVAPIENVSLEVEQKLFDLKDNLTKHTCGKVKIETQLSIGTFFPELENICNNIKPYTVIIGSQGTTALERLLFGGHAVYAMKHLMWPLITVPLNASFSPIKKIVMTCNLNEVVDTIPREEIKTLITDFKAELHILVVDKHGVFNPETDYESVLLLELMTELRPEYHFITNKHIDDAITEFAEKNKIDLLIILPKRYDLLTRLIHKSHTRQLVLYSPVPVMALHQS